MLRAAAAATALALLAFAPAAADAGRVLVKPAKKAAQLKAEHDAALPGVGKDTLRHELGVARGFEKQEALGPVEGRGVFSGKSKATGARRVAHLRLVSSKPTDVGPGMRVQSEVIDGEVDEPAEERFFRPVAGASRTAVQHQADDGARFLLLAGRGVFDYHGGDFEGDPEVGFGPAPAPTPTPAP